MRQSYWLLHFAKTRKCLRRQEGTVALCSFKKYLYMDDAFCLWSSTRSYSGTSLTNAPFLASHSWITMNLVIYYCNLCDADFRWMFHCITYRLLQYLRFIGPSNMQQAMIKIHTKTHKYTPDHFVTCHVFLHTVRKMFIKNTCQWSTSSFHRHGPR